MHRKGYVRKKVNRNRGKTPRNSVLSVRSESIHDQEKGHTYRRSPLANFLVNLIKIDPNKGKLILKEISPRYGPKIPFNISKIKKETARHIETSAQRAQGSGYPKQAIRKLGPSDRQSNKDQNPTQAAARKLPPDAYPGRNNKRHEEASSSNRSAMDLAR